MPSKEISPFARAILGSIDPYEPGKPICEVQRELGLTDIIKLASNENPLGPSPRALDAIKAVLSDLHRYPDGAGHDLKTRLSTHLAIPAECIVLGNGSTELVELVTEAFIGEGEPAVIGRYEFFKYRIAVQIMNGLIRWVEMPGLEYDVEAMAEAAIGAKVLFIANPNNPTGTMLKADAVDWLMERIPPQVIVVFDEAYYDYRDPAIYPDTMKLVKAGRNVIIMRTFSKSYGLAGLRVGYAITTPAIAQALNRVRETFNVNSLGQIAAIAALDDVDYLQRGVRLNRDQIPRFYAQFKAMGLEFVPTAANFILFKGGIPGRQLFCKLLERGVIVRPMDSYGLGDYVRVSVGLPEENDVFFDKLREVVVRG
jgi:histidinol-phosphate aminotransferase